MLVNRVWTILDRYGLNYGKYLSPNGTPFDHRAIPPSSLDSPYTQYKVLKPLPVQSGTAASWFGKPGGGVQYKTEYTVGWLLAKEFIKELQ